MLKLFVYRSLVFRQSYNSSDAPMTVMKISLIIIFLGSILAMPSLHAEPRYRDQERDQRAQISRERAADIARKRYNGRVLDVRPQRREGRQDYRVKILREGRVRVLRIDGETGEVRR